jgi:chromosome segregation ATPase
LPIQYTHTQDSTDTFPSQPQLADAKASAASLEKHMSARVGEMKAKVETLEHSLAKKRDDREANRLRNELVSLERQRASQVAELETQVADIVAALREARREGQYAEEKRITAEKQAKAIGIWFRRV